MKTLMKNLMIDPVPGNSRRLMAAATELTDYAEHGGPEPDMRGAPGLVEDAVSDLLTEVMHFCRINEIDFDARLRSAAGNFRYEETAAFRAMERRREAANH